MRYKELVEDAFGGMLDSKIMQDGFELIKRDCRPYLQQNKSPIFRTPIFRGLGMLKVSDSIIIKKQVRLDYRQTKDMNVSIHIAMNDWMTKKFGEPFRNGLFVSGSRNVVNMYGRTYIIFPIGNFTFLYHDKFSDIYSTYSSFHWTYQDDIGNTPDKKTMTKFSKKFVKHIASVNNGNWKQDTIEQASMSKNEIMIRCKEYYAVRNDTIARMADKTSLQTLAQLEKELLG